jgi:hypothetical protein
MKRLGKIFISVVVLAFIGLTVIEVPYHFKMNTFLKPLKQEFTQVIKDGYDKASVNYHSDGTSVSLDYGGRLDAIIRKRDWLLKQNGYITLGGWHARDYRYADFSAIYLKVKF